MFSKFLQLDEEKQNRIINASLKVFSKSDYKNASTDEIIKEAGISKGALFYYFKNKKILYEYLFEYVVNYLKQKILTHIDFNDRDLLNRLKQILIYKMNVIMKYPDMNNFILKAISEDSQVIGIDIQKKSREISETIYGLFFNNIDTDLFRNDLDITYLLNTIIWTSEGFSNKFLAEIKNKEIDQSFLNQVIYEYTGYLDFFRKSFYKER